RLLHEHARHQDHKREQDVDDDEDVEQERRHGHDQQQNDANGADGHRDLAEVADHESTPVLGRVTTEGVEAAGASAGWAIVCTLPSAAEPRALSAMTNASTLATAS